MSNRNNDVFSVLPVTNTEILQSGQVENLGGGQLGIFDADTNEAVNPFMLSNLTKKVYFAVGIDTNGDFGTDDFRFSAGQYIERGQVKDVSTQPYNAGSPMVVSIGNYKAKADTEYGIRVEFRNAKINRIQGFNQFSKAYLVKTPCAQDCAVGCDSTDANVLTQLFVDVINADIAGLIKAEAIARQNIDGEVAGLSSSYNAGDVVSAADVEALTVYNATALDVDKLYTDVKLTSQPLKIGSYCQINLHYYKLLETVLIVSLIEGFNCSGAVTTNVYPVYAQGTGGNIIQKEYHASGWAGSGPYKLSQVTGTGKGNIQYLANKNGTYDQVIVQYAQVSQSGWQEYSNTLSTIFALPENTGLTSALVQFFNNFK